MAVLRHLLCSRFCSGSPTWKVPSDLNNPAEKVKLPIWQMKKLEAGTVQASDLPRPPPLTGGRVGPRFRLSLTPKKPILLPSDLIHIWQKEDAEIPTP